MALFSYILPINQQKLIKLHPVPADPCQGRANVHYEIKTDRGSINSRRSATRLYLQSQVFLYLRLEREKRKKGKLPFSLFTIILEGGKMWGAVRVL